MGDFMKQAQQMQESLQKVQEKIAKTEVVGESGAGMVRVTMNGRHDVKRVHIEQSVLSEDKSMLEDLVAAAVNDAVRKIEGMNQDNMAEATAGVSLPPGMTLPF